jgi:hypothetical protein
MRRKPTLLDCYFFMLPACSVYCRRPISSLSNCLFQMDCSFLCIRIKTTTSVLVREVVPDLKIGQKKLQFHFCSCYNSLKFEIDIYRTTFNCTFHIFFRSFLEAILLSISVAWQFPSLPFRVPPAKFRVGFLLFTFTFENSRLFYFIRYTKLSRAFQRLEHLKKINARCIVLRPGLSGSAFSVMATYGKKRSILPSFSTLRDSGVHNIGKDKVKKRGQYSHFVRKIHRLVNPPDHHDLLRTQS